MPGLVEERDVAAAADAAAAAREAELREDLAHVTKRVEGLEARASRQFPSACCILLCVIAVWSVVWWDKREYTKRRRKTAFRAPVSGTLRDRAGPPRCGSWARVAIRCLRRGARRQKGVFPGLVYRHFPGSPK